MNRNLIIITWSNITTRETHSHTTPTFTVWYVGRIIAGRINGEIA